MKNKFYVLLFIPLLLTGCKKGDYKQREDEKEETDLPTDKKASELSEEELKYVPALLVNKLKSYQSYKSVTEGKTVTNALIFNIEQSINTTVIKSEYSYLLNESHSDMHNIVHTAYYHNDKALYKDTAQKSDQKEYTLSNLNDYLNIYGTYPFDNGIEGYSISKGSVISVTRLESESDYKFKITFDKEKSTNNIKIQMKRFGDLDDYPSFNQNTTMEILMKDDYTPISLKLSLNYKVSKTFPVNCQQDYVVTYSDFDKTIEIPDLELVKNKL